MYQIDKEKALKEGDLPEDDSEDEKKEEKKEDEDEDDKNEEKEKQEEEEEEILEPKNLKMFKTKSMLGQKAADNEELKIEMPKI
eukprot:CAMPEP_0114579132 /NCGR_PEP_ID=MMETSP0125-20121206/3570_1 /TAXON_ID=485358 ORGANISM="Aristerostoma sp., Strain ATCC 50986" /NCGR_SAMPLE_ID=MMETSP0125 /ASSEMBLY_ACC=CAM_ASM_000245 /LENGTH=83 /DNA_ID=CAMNT_0001769693 /DNA_START=2932 /DNA_END=3183 /DNA_ORIENTATION=-